MAVPYNVLNLSSVDEHIKNLETYLGYLEKATATWEILQLLVKL